MKFNKLIPELSVTDINKSLSFYKDILGFKIIYERKENNFAFIELENNQIMLDQINSNWNTGKLEYPFGRGINLSIEIKDVEKIYNNLLNLNYPIFEKININEYRKDKELLKNKEFLVQDPDGYLLRFNQNID